MANQTRPSMKQLHALQDRVQAFTQYMARIEDILQAEGQPKHKLEAIQLEHMKAVSVQSFLDETYPIKPF